MRAGVRRLLASAWLGLAGVSGASAQGDPAAPATSLQGCGPVCRLFQGTPAPAQPAEPLQLQPAPARDGSVADRSRRSRRNANRNAQREAAAEEGRAERRARPKAPRNAPSRTAARPRPVPADVEQTASLPQGPGEVLFVSGADEAHRAIAGDLAGVVGPDLAVRTIPGRGLPLRDVLSLPGADLTVTSSLAMARNPAYADKVVYLAKLFTEELHALAGPGIARLEDLEGKPVHLGPPDSDSEAAARAFLQARGISVTPAGASFAGALTDVREGRIAAAFILAPKPFAPLAELRSGDSLRFLPLPYRTSDAVFHPAALGAGEYPGLIGAGERVETVALDAILVAPRWREDTPRQRELAAFTTRLFERLASLGEGRHPKWKETNLATGVDGFWRLKAAQQWVAVRLKGAEPGSAAGARDSGRAGQAP